MKLLKNNPVVVARKPYVYTPPPPRKDAKLTPWWDKDAFEEFKSVCTYKSGVDHDTFT